MGPDFSFYKRRDGRYIIDVKKELNANIMENIETIGSNKIFKNRDTFFDTCQVTVLLPQALVEDIEIIKKQERQVENVILESLKKSSRCN